ncbi:MAG: serine hydrolase domain-containing protein [Bythopirellula sp.]|nr:serine hydrolase domain-containing protein [Bythopirellula sp.]
MLRLFLCVFVSFVSFVVEMRASAAELPTSMPAAEGMSAAKLAEVGKIMNGFINDHKIAGGIVLVARNGKVLFHEPYGLMNLETKQPVTRDTIFRIYSMSKAITSAAALILHDEGKLDLQAPVAKYLPEFTNMKIIDGDKQRPAECEMTVEQLFTHTSGITYGNPQGNQTEVMMELTEALDMQSDLALMTTKLSQIPLPFEPGTDWKYGAGIDVLGRVVEIVSGKPLDEFLSKRIFEPLGMTDTGFYVPAEKVERFAANYYSDGKGRMIIRDDPQRSGYLRKPGLLSGGGGLVGTASDYMRFLLMIAGDGEFNGQRILSKESVDLMRTDQVPKLAGWVKFGEEERTGVGYGLGFSVTTEAHKNNPHAKQGEYGWGGAASTHYWLSPDDDLVVVMMEQRMPYSPETEEKLKPVIYGAVEK